jgi:hypothetical protein
MMILFGISLIPILLKNIHFHKTSVTSFTRKFYWLVKAADQYSTSPVFPLSVSLYIYLLSVDIVTSSVGVSTAWPGRPSA